MVLTHGNLRKKSRILRHFVLSADPFDRYAFSRDQAAYEKGLSAFPFMHEYKKIGRFLHDATIEKLDRGTDLIFSLEYYDRDKECGAKARLVFMGGEILSLNKYRKSGKITRLNTRVRPQTYLYDEMYAEGKTYFITIAFCPHEKIRTLYGYLLMTITFTDLKVVLAAAAAL